MDQPTTAPMCKLCGSPHWGYEPHNFDKPVEPSVGIMVTTRDRAKFNAYQKDYQAKRREELKALREENVRLKAQLAALGAVTLPQS